MTFDMFNFYSGHQLSFRFGDNRENALFECGDNVASQLILTGGQPLSGTVRLCLEDGRGGMTEQIHEAAPRISFTIGRETPGFIQCSAEWCADGRKPVTIRRSVGFSADKILPPPVEPEDFMDFWRGLFREADSLEAVRMIPVEEKDDSSSTRLFELHVPTLNGRMLYGYLSIPRRSGKYPIIICFPGSCPACGPQDWLRYEDAITLFMDVHFYQFRAGESDADAMKRAGYNPNDYATIGIESRDTFFYHDVLPGMHRAVSFVQTLPEYRGSGLGVFGSSQGGWLSIMTAAFHPEISAICANVPAFTQPDSFEAANRAIAARGNDPEYKAKVMETLRYYSSSFAARHITAPATVIVGRIDKCCPPTAVYALYNQLNGRKMICNEMDMEHECRASYQEGIQALHQYLLKKPAGNIG